MTQLKDLHMGKCLNDLKSRYDLPKNIKQQKMDPLVG